MSERDCGCSDGCCGTGPGSTPVGLGRMPRRDFVRTAALGAVGLSLDGPLGIVAGPFTAQERGDHFVPADKRLSPAWIRALFDRGEPTWYAGSDLATIGMPVGGVCAGQVYLTGDGRLVDWHVFNQNQNTGYGLLNYRVGRTAEETVANGEVVPTTAVAQGFAVRARVGGRALERTLDARGFPGVRFRGEHPIGRVAFEDAAFPLAIELEAFSPFVPLASNDSTLPVTVLRYKVRNTGDAPAEVTLAGWLENAACVHNAPFRAEGLRRVNAPLEADGLVGVRSAAVEVTVPPREERAPIVIADFEGADYGAWTLEGRAFGSGPARGTLPAQNPVSGYDGRGLVNTYLGGDDPTGRIVSPPFRIERPWITFLVGGGRKPDTAFMRLVVDGEAVRSATGRSRERLEPESWDVSDLIGREARIEIVDEAMGDWGHVNVDQIEQRDRRSAPPRSRAHGAVAGLRHLRARGAGRRRPGARRRDGLPVRPRWLAPDVRARRHGRALDAPGRRAAGRRGAPRVHARPRRGAGGALRGRMAHAESLSRGALGRESVHDALRRRGRGPGACRAPHRRAHRAYTQMARHLV